jgi:hypothetical protein
VVKSPPRASPEDTSIRPFPKVHISDATLADLRRRIAATRWPDKEIVTDASQGVQLATMKKLASYWQSNYNWRKVEARLNALPQFVTTIDGVDIQFIYVRSKNKNALPIIITHGWPGSIIEQMKVIDPLVNPTAHGGKCVRLIRRSDTVAPRLRIFREADNDWLGSAAYRARVDGADETPGIQALRGARRRLG